MPFNDIMHDGDLRYRVEKLERRQREDNSGRRLENSSIGAGGLRLIDGGSIEIDGGELRLISEDGVVVARWGDTYYGDWSRGWEFFYPSGQRAFLMGGSPENPAIVIYDVGGRVVFATDAASRNGLARPYLNYRMVPTRNSEVVTNGPFWPSVEGGSYTPLFEGLNAFFHPRISFGVLTAAVSGDTEWRLRIEDTTIATGSGGGGDVWEIPGWGSDFLPGNRYRLRLDVRQSDSTRAWAQITRCYGTQS